MTTHIFNYFTVFILYYAMQKKSTDNQIFNADNIYTKGVYNMDTYDKNGKKQKGYYPSSQRKIWNCTETDGIKSDVLGSYSGTDDDDDMPVQDADDL